MEADKKRRPLEFEEGDFVWAVLTKDQFPVGEYNKMAVRKIGLVETVKKINANAYQLKLPSHIKTSDIFNVKHLVLFIEDSSEEDANSRGNYVQLGEDDVYQDAWEYLRKTQVDASVKTRKMVTRSQMQAAIEEVLAKPQPTKEVSALAKIRQVSVVKVKRRS